MKKAGGFIPGIRPGKPTSDYLNRMLNYIVFIGAVALAFIAFVPIFFNGVFGADVSFGGTSIIIIVGVVIGAIAISTGTGGAIFLTPVLVGFMNWDIKKAVGTTLFFIIFGSISGFISLSANGLVDYDAGVAVGIGSLIGVYFGVKLSHHVSKTVQKRALLILYAIMFVLTLNKIVSELNVL